jgi:hypothetical protein
VAAQALGVCIGVTRPSGEHQFHPGVEIFKGIDQKMAVFLRRKPAQEKDIVVREQIPLNQLPGDAPGRKGGSVRNVNGIALVLFAVMLMQRARNDHGGIGRGHGSRFSPAQYTRRNPAPFAALPVETLHCDDGLFAGKPRKKRKQCRSQAVLMDDIVVRRRSMCCAQQSVDDCFQMLGTNSRQPAHAHAVVRVHGRSEIAAAIYGDFVPQAGQLMAGLLVIGFDAVGMDADEQRLSAEKKADRIQWRYAGK